MPRVAPRLAATRPEAVTRPLPRVRKTKKPAIQQDRLTARTLFIRRVKRSLRPGMWFLGGLCVVMLGSEALRAIPAVGSVNPGGTIRHGFAAIAAVAGFRVQKIEILGADTTPLPVIEAALGIRQGEPSLAVSLTAAASRLAQLGPVQSAVVQRALPGTIIVTITERSPYAIWQTQAPDGAAKFVLIDKSGNVIANQDAALAKRRDPELLLFVGQDAPAHAAALMAELYAAPAVLAHVAAAERIDGLRWNLTLKNQTVVKLPVDDEQNAIATLATLQASMALLDRPVESIDLRQPDRMVVHPYPAAHT
jgi:cell division protein FtsQ